MSISAVLKSRLNFGTPRIIGGIEHFDMLELPEIPVQPDDISYDVTGADRIDLLAFKFYGNRVLWWVIAQVNDMELLPVDLVPGRTIRIPSPRFVAQALFQVTPSKRRGL